MSVEMSAAAMDVPRHEPTHRYGRRLDDRLAASGVPPWARGEPAGPAPNGGRVDVFASANSGEPLSFSDVIDIVNPLHHLPIIGPIYRELSGDEIGEFARVAGGGLFGGLIGAVVSLGNVLLEEVTGDDLGGHVMTALLGDDGETPAGGTLLADAGEAASAANPAAQAPAAQAPGAPDAATPPPVPPPVPLPAQARPPAATAVPAASGAAAGPIPQLSPAAFEALMQSFGSDTVAAAEPAARAYGPAAAAALASPATGSRVDAAL